MKNLYLNCKNISKVNMPMLALINVNPEMFQEALVKNLDSLRNS